MLPRIIYQISRTLNMGGYESTKIQIGLEIDAAADTKEAVSVAYAKAKQFVESHIAAEEAKCRL
jgi:hypothetical protein